MTDYGCFLTSISLVNHGCSDALHRRRQPGRKRMPTTKTGGSKRGFAAMDPAKQREIASKGGKASHGGGRRKGSISR
jgi:general stress protein YciG